MGRKKTSEAYEKALTSTREFLRRGPRTAADVAERFGVSRFAAYERIRALEQRKLVFDAGVSRDAGKTGPRARLYSAAA